MKVLVAGSLNMDLIVQVDRFPNEGETLLGKTFTQLIGGKGANQASASARQDVATMLWGAIGQDDFGSYTLQRCKELNINTVVSKVFQNTGTAIIETDNNGKNRIVVIPGANIEFTPEKVKENLHLLDEYDILVMQFEIPLDTIVFLAKEAKKRQKVVIVNPAPVLPMSEELLQNIDYIIPNEHELSAITGKETDTLEQIERAVLTLSTKVPNILVTLGEKGVYVFSPSFKGIIKGYRVKAIDTTGAGDAFIGSFSASLAKGFSIYDAVIYANKSAAISVTKKGAFNSAGSPEEIKSL
ncbi:MAG: ribokinase [Brevinemataceae bacterium]